jgi:murein DD-endopeptidase MepM/ murein hydrolase activator NlpD
MKRRRHHPLPELAGRRRSGSLGRALRGLALVAIAGALVVLGAWIVWGGWGRTQVEIVSPLEVVGRRTPLSARIRAGRAGLRSFEIRLEGGGVSHVVAAGDFPRDGLLGSGVREHRVDVEIDASALGVPEGDARLVVLADEYAPASRLRGRAEALSASVRVDLSPPDIALRSGRQGVSTGGSGIAVYGTSPDTTRSGVAVGPNVFPGRTETTGGSGPYVALFAVPYDLEAPLAAVVFAEDAAGNRREAPLTTIVKKKAFPAEEIDVTDDFVSAKIPDLLARNGLAATTDPVEAYLLVNRDLRAKTEERVRELTRDSAPRLLFEGAFLQQPGTAVGSRFAEHRTYRYNGRVIDEQVHLGTDLASVKHDPVIAANAGSVTFTGDLGIYGNTVIIDHGLGLATLYAHLSQIDVASGQSVARGDLLGRSGETGLAGGDHLHFSVMIAGVHVDPTEWWDAKWIRDHIAPELARLAAAPAPVADVGLETGTDAPASATTAHRPPAATP